MRRERARVQACIELVNEAADGAGDEDVTPSRIAAAIEAALASPGLRSVPDVGPLLRQALDAVEDGMAADYIGSILYSALARLESGR